MVSAQQSFGLNARALAAATADVKAIHMSPVSLFFDKLMSPVFKNFKNSHAVCRGQAIPQQQ